MSSCWLRGRGAQEALNGAVDCSVWPGAPVTWAPETRRPWWRVGLLPRVPPRPPRSGVGRPGSASGTTGSRSGGSRHRRCARCAARSGGRRDGQGEEAFCRRPASRDVVAIGNSKFLNRAASSGCSNQDPGARASRRERGPTGPGGGGCAGSARRLGLTGHGARRPRVGARGAAAGGNRVQKVPRVRQAAGFNWRPEAEARCPGLAPCSRRPACANLSRIGSCMPGGRLHADGVLTLGHGLAAGLQECWFGGLPATERRSNSNLGEARLPPRAPSRRATATQKDSECRISGIEAGAGPKGAARGQLRPDKPVRCSNGRGPRLRRGDGGPQPRLSAFPGIPSHSGAPSQQFMPRRVPASRRSGRRTGRGASRGSWASAKERRPSAAAPASRDTLHHVVRPRRRRPP